MSVQLRGAEEVWYYGKVGPVGKGRLTSWADGIHPHTFWACFCRRRKHQASNGKLGGAVCAARDSVSGKRGLRR